MLYYIILYIPISGLKNLYLVMQHAMLYYIIYTYFRINEPASCNAACYFILYIPISGLTNPYLVMQHAMSDPKHYLVLLITGVVSALPR